MKLVIFGLTISSSWGNGHATLWRGLGQALAERGHHLVFFERDTPRHAGAHRDLPDWRDGELQRYADWADALPLAREHLDDADVGIVTSYCPDALAATELLLGSRTPMRVFYDLDTAVTLGWLESGGAVPYLGPRGLADFDLVLSCTGGQALEQLQQRLGAGRVAPLYGSVDPSAHHRMAPEDRFRSDLSYLGTYTGDCQTALELLFVQPARRLPQRRFAIAGVQYPAEFPWTANMSYYRHLEPAQTPAFYSSSRVTLNVPRPALKAMGYCPSGRLFEAAACGAAILSDPWEGLGLFFEPGSEILVARTTEEAMAVLQLPEVVTQRIGRRAFERVLDEHTATHRARDLEIILENTARAADEEQLGIDREDDPWVDAAMSARGVGR